METKFTKKEWWIDDEGFVAAGFSDEYVTIADADCSKDIDIDERAANAKLIAAAPDMFKACILLLENAEIDALNETEEENPDLHEAINAGINAIKKARE